MCLKKNVHITYVFPKVYFCNHTVSTWPFLRGGFTSCGQVNDVSSECFLITDDGSPLFEQAEIWPSFFSSHICDIVNPLEVKDAFRSRISSKGISSLRGLGIFGELSRDRNPFSWLFSFEAVSPRFEVDDRPGVTLATFSLRICAANPGTLFTVNIGRWWSFGLWPRPNPEITLKYYSVLIGSSN